MTNGQNTRRLHWRTQNLSLIFSTSLQVVVSFRSQRNLLSTTKSPLSQIMAEIVEDWLDIQGEIKIKSWQLTQIETECSPVTLNRLVFAADNELKGLKFN